MANHTIAQERETLQGKLRQADGLIAECETLLERASAAKNAAVDDLQRAYDVRTNVLNEIVALRARSDAEFDAMLQPSPFGEPSQVAAE